MRITEQNVVEVMATVEEVVVVEVLPMAPLQEVVDHAVVVMTTPGMEEIVGQVDMAVATKMVLVSRTVVVVVLAVEIIGKEVGP